jgi:hypothetical protein
VHKNIAVDYGAFKNGVPFEVDGYGFTFMIFLDTYML